MPAAEIELVVVPWTRDDRRPAIVDGELDVTLCQVGRQWLPDRAGAERPALVWTVVAEGKEPVAPPDDADLAVTDVEDSRHRVLEIGNRPGVEYA